MTGIVSSMADDLVLGNLTLALAGVVCLLAFVAGAMCTAIMVNWGLRQKLRSSYSLPLLLESAALLVFGLFGAAIAAWSQVFVSVTVVLLCFIMGLQNAVITKISKAEIRTTHVTGLVTDIGIELGKMAYINRTRGEDTLHVRADRNKFKRLSGLLACFFVGGIVGAYGFSRFGFAAVLPFSVLLMVIGIAGLISPVAGPKAPTSNT